MSLLYPCKIVSHFQEKTLLCSKHEPNTRNLSCSQRFFSIRILEHILTTMIDMKDKKQKETKKSENKQKIIQHIYTY